MSMSAQQSTSNNNRPNYDFAKSIEDSLKLSRSRHTSAQNKLHSQLMHIPTPTRDFQSVPQVVNRPPSQPPLLHPSQHLLQLTQSSMPALHINYPAMPGAYIPPGHNQPQRHTFTNRDPYLQNAYDRLQHRRALLTAIKYAPFYRHHVCIFCLLLLVFEINEIKFIYVIDEMQRTEWELSSLVSCVHLYDSTLYLFHALNVQCTIDVLLFIFLKKGWDMRDGALLLWFSCYR